MDDQPAGQQPLSPEPGPETGTVKPVSSPSPPGKRSFVAWPFLWTVVFLEALLLGATVAIGMLYGMPSAGNFMFVLFFPALGLIGLAFLLLCWRQAVLRRSLIGWILFLVHALGLGVGVKLTMELSDNAESYSGRLKLELSTLLTTIARGGAVADSTSLADSLGFQEDGGEQMSMALDSVDVPDISLAMGDSQVVDAVFGWRIVVRRDSRSEGISRTMVSAEDRVELAVKDSGQAWTASGPVHFQTCGGTATVAFLQVGMCPKLGTTAHPVEGFGCEESVRLYDLAVSLRQPAKQFALPSLPGSADQVKAQARSWITETGCVE
ncbi:MAG: hypothetical protein RL318_2709 [Fibrobacterota bacterium]